MTRPVALVESPYLGQGLEAVRYLFCCLLDSVLRGEAPIASHAIFPLCLPENVEAHGTGQSGRDIGLECRDSLALLRENALDGGDASRQIRTVRYVDIGSTQGMWRQVGLYGYDRRLEGEAKRIWEAGEWPAKTRWSSTNE